MRLISWNVNGLRACLTKGFEESMNSLDADIISIQETKMQEGQAKVDFPEYEEYFNSAEKKGYSGTAVFTRIKPISVVKNFGDHTDEGRGIIVEYNDFYLVNVYVPNSQDKLARIDYRMKWEDDFREMVLELDKKKPVIICGDMNVAHEEIDLKNPKTNRGNAGFSDEERNKMTELLEAGFVDTFRYKYPDRAGIYSWWSYRFNARKNNAGWRIDYFIVSDRLKNKIKDAKIHTEVLGSDHCPVELEIDL
ncbi:MAG: exodeoxyribonuclease III [Eubacteriales bacterium]|nr:exodeoxyribonuclease III [Eubacteriales bacterium]